MTQGGKRKGAGRPPGTTKKNTKVRYATRLRPGQVRFLKTLPNQAAWLEAAIKEKRDRESKQHRRTFKSVLCRNWRHI